MCTCKTGLIIDPLSLGGFKEQTVDRSTHEDMALEVCWPRECWECHWKGMRMDGPGPGYLCAAGAERACG